MRLPHSNCIKKNYVIVSIIIISYDILDTSKKAEGYKQVFFSSIK